MAVCFEKKEEKIYSPFPMGIDAEKEGFPVYEALPEAARNSLFPISGKEGLFGDAAEELEALLDLHHTQRWGLKEFYRHVDLEVRPCVPRDRMFSVLNGRLDWTYRNSPLFLKMEEDFTCAMCERSAARSCFGPDNGTVEAWRKRHAVEPLRLHVDLLYLSRYDHQAYAHFPPHPNDAWGYLNADRFFFVMLPNDNLLDEGSLLEAVGKMHLHIHELSCMLMPGFADKDSNGLDGPFSLVFVSQATQTARSVVQRLKKYGRSLALPSRTIEIWTLGLESLRSFPNKENTVVDLLPKIAYPVHRLG